MQRWVCLCQLYDGAKCGRVCGEGGRTEVGALQLREGILPFRKSICATMYGQVCRVTYARIQGRDALIGKFRRSRYTCIL